MKALSDNKEVEDRGYYYLLDWNERNSWQYIFATFNKHRLCDLNIKEYYQLFAYATQIDTIEISKSFGPKPIKDSFSREEVIENMWQAYKASNTVFEDELALRAEFDNWIQENL